MKVTHSRTAIAERFRRFIAASLLAAFSFVNLLAVDDLTDLPGYPQEDTWVDTGNNTAYPEDEDDAFLIELVEISADFFEDLREEGADMPPEVDNFIDTWREAHDEGC